MTLTYRYNQPRTPELQAFVGELSDRAQELKTSIVEAEENHKKFLATPTKKYAVLADMVAVVNEANQAIAAYEQSMQTLKADLAETEKQLALKETQLAAAMDFDAKMAQQEAYQREFNSHMKAAFEVLFKLNQVTGSGTYISLQLPVFVPSTPSQGYHMLETGNICKDGVVDFSKYSGEAS